MRVSIITAVYNNVNTIESALESVLSQDYEDVEYIIVDGNSSDGTSEIIEKYRDKISVYIREKDKGIYDALNKGVAAASGEIVGFLHSDDFYRDTNVISKVVDVFKREKTESVYGDLQYVRKNNVSKVVRHWKSSSFTKKLLKWGWMPPHPTFFVKKGCYEQYGSFDLQYKIAADYEIILRFLGKHRITTSYLPEVLVCMRVGGASNKNLRNMWIKSVDDYKALSAHRIGGVGTLLMKNISKFPQFLT